MLGRMERRCVVESCHRHVPAEFLELRGDLHGYGALAESGGRVQEQHARAAIRGQVVNDLSGFGAGNEASFGGRRVDPRLLALDSPMEKATYGVVPGQQPVDEAHSPQVCSNLRGPQSLMEVVSAEGGYRSDDEVGIARIEDLECLANGSA